MTRHSDDVLGLWENKHQDIWVVLDVNPSADRDGWTAVKYAYIHQLGETDAISEFSVDPESPVDYEPLFDEVT